MPRPAGLDFLVDRSDWRQHRFDAAPAPTLGPGQVLFRVDRFAFTANNISYALAGEMLGYWRFFPAPEGWGRLPTMGFGDVIASEHPEVAPGTRCFGFYPMSRYLVIEPCAVSSSQILDGAAHRKGLAPAYSQYAPTGGDPLYQPEHEDALMLMRGLFLTSFLAEDFLGEREFGEQAVLISSASSKTSIALGHLVVARGRARAVGLTSARNLEFVRKLGCYDQVATYDEVGSLDAATPTVYVDMAGNSALRHRVHEHFGARLAHSCAIGATHWDQTGGGDEGLPGPKPEFFFAPAQIQRRASDWGPAELQRRLAEAWSGFRSFSEGWLQVRRGAGRDAVARVYRETLAGRSEPRHGHVLSLWDSAGIDPTPEA
jgi:NADPH:quinone reductase-like Zn-dependent oxidoreductase